MSRVSAEASDVIDASPAVVYDILADYRDGHPNILPRQYFAGIEVEAGGRGAGTVVRVRMRAFGVERAYRMVIAEPDPGRVLVEADPDAGVETTFTVTPVDEGRRAHLRIATEWAPKRGIAGVMERLSNPPVARRIYKKELRQLAAYVREKGATPKSL